MNNFSGIITFQVEHGKERLPEIVKKLKIIHYAVSLGHHRSLLFYLHSEDLLQTSFKFSTPAQHDSWNTYAGEGVFRLSTGLEDADDLITDLMQALD
jgi:methionine-gamma-lyase